MIKYDSYIFNFNHSFIHSTNGWLLNICCEPGPAVLRNHWQ